MAIIAKPELLAATVAAAAAATAARMLRYPQEILSSIARQFIAE